MTARIIDGLDNRREARKNPWGYRNEGYYEGVTAMNLMKWENAVKLSHRQPSMRPYKL